MVGKIIFFWAVIQQLPLLNPNSELLCPVVANIEEKFEKYWKNISFLYSFAFILDDPRMKIEIFYSILNFIGQNIYMNYIEITYHKIEGKFHVVYRSYEEEI